MEFIQQFSPLGWAVIALATFIVGFGKTAVPALGIIVVPLLTTQMDGRLAAGIIMPLYVVADLAAIRAYYRQAQPRFILRLVPWAYLGIAAGAVLGNVVSREVFNTLLGAVILLTAALSALVKSEIAQRIPRGVAPIVGVIAGLATMIGNAGSTIMALYLLLMGFQKERFLGTAAFFFLVINVSKTIPHALLWGTLHWGTLLVCLIVAPALVFGAFIGPRVLRFIPVELFRTVILVLSAVAGLRLIIG